MVNNKQNTINSNYSLILDLKFTDPIFTFACHPERNLIATGLLTGHVSVLSYNDKELSSTKECTQYVYGNENELIDIKWKTKRHNGSCRSLAFNSTGDSLFTVGTDKVIKKAHTETGKVILKTTLKITQDFTKLVVSPTKQHIVVGTEAGHIYIYDSRSLNEMNKILNLHDDSVNGICQLSDYTYLSSGSTTLTHFDIRKGIIQKSEDQEDEILSVCKLDQDNVVCGMGTGVVTLWKLSRNAFTDQISRVRVSDESIECVVPCLEDEGDTVWAGCADGLVSKIDIKRGKVLETRLHHLDDEIAMIDLDYDYRLCTMGMERLKIWSNKENVEEEEEDEDEKPVKKQKKKVKMTAKQLKNLHTHHEHGIKKFDI